MTINNIGSMVLSIGGKDGGQDNYVIVLSVCNCAGRIISGLLSDLVASKMNR